jgi:hypothetical protein
MDLFSFGFLNRNVPLGLTGVKRFGDCFTSRNVLYITVNGGVCLLGIFLVVFRRNGSARLPLLFPLILIFFVTTVFFGLVRTALLALPVILIFQAAVIQKLASLLVGIVPARGWTWIKLGIVLIPLAVPLVDGTRPAVLKRTEGTNQIQRIENSPFTKEDLPGSPPFIPGDYQEFQFLSGNEYPFQHP